MIELFWGSKTSDPSWTSISKPGPIPQSVADERVGARLFPVLLTEPEDIVAELVSQRVGVEAARLPDYVGAQVPKAGKSVDGYTVLVFHPNRPSRGAARFEGDPDVGLLLRNLPLDEAHAVDHHLPFSRVADHSRRARNSPLDLLEESLPRREAKVDEQAELAVRCEHAGAGFGVARGSDHERGQQGGPEPPLCRLDGESREDAGRRIRADDGKHSLDHDQLHCATNVCCNSMTGGPSTCRCQAHNLGHHGLPDRIFQPQHSGVSSQFTS